MKGSPLGKKIKYIDTYTPSLLFSIPRKVKRDAIGVSEPLLFMGRDIWNAYELSWLNEKGKPQVAFGEFNIPATSQNLIESKSLKLYLNSFNQSVFRSMEEVVEILAKDLSAAVEATVDVRVFPLHSCEGAQLCSFDGVCLDGLDIAIDTYQPHPYYLVVEDEVVSETLYSNLLKSNCLVTGQPDWGSVQIQYHGKRINHEGLLKYIISLRQHDEFHEQCVERIFMDILRCCTPNKLTVYARYVRRGGLDINPIRTTESFSITNQRLFRQ